MLDAVCGRYILGLSEGLYEGAIYSEKAAYDGKDDDCEERDDDAGKTVVS